MSTPANAAALIDHITNTLHTRPTTDHIPPAAVIDLFTAVRHVLETLPDQDGTLHTLATEYARAWRQSDGTADDARENLTDHIERNIAP